MKTPRVTRIVRSVDGIVRRDSLPRVSQREQREVASRRWFWSAILGATSLFLIVVTAVPLTAFEASVINVIARLEDRPCVEHKVRSLGYWKMHQSEWIFPQTLGPEVITTPAEAVAVFSASGSSMRNRLKKQLLALKFNIAGYGSGDGFVPGEGITLLDLAAEADQLLSQDPPAGNVALETMKNRVENANVAKKVSTCPGEPVCDEEESLSAVSGGEESALTVQSAETLQGESDPEPESQDDDVPAAEDPGDNSALESESTDPSVDAPLETEDQIVSADDASQEPTPSDTSGVPEDGAPAEADPEEQALDPEPAAMTDTDSNETVPLPEPVIIPETQSIPEEPSIPPAETVPVAVETPLAE